jgi:hypothetical protein
LMGINNIFCILSDFFSPSVQWRPRNVNTFYLHKGIFLKEKKTQTTTSTLPIIWLHFQIHIIGPGPVRQTKSFKKAGELKEFPSR